MLLVKEILNTISVKKLLKQAGMVCMLLFMQLSVQAQCAMCRSTIENNVSDDSSVALAAHLNSGIIYLFVMPYLIIATIAFLWYRQSKKKAHV